MSPTRRLQAAVAILTAILITGIAGYVLIEDMSILDALYMTLITISTVGYDEVTPLSDTGRYFTVVVIIAGVGTALYTAVTAVELGVERFLGGEGRRKRMANQVSALRDHVILCGFGRVGANAWRSLVEGGSDCVVIELDPDRAAHAADEGALVIEGDATRDEVLTEAGIDSAASLIASVRNDAENLVIVLSAKSRRPDLNVVARTTEIESESKLRLAGADRVVAPQVVGAQRLAALARQPELAEFLDLALHGDVIQFRIEEVKVAEEGDLAGQSLRESRIRERSGALVLAIEDEGGRLNLNPDPTVPFRPGQTIIGIGTTEQVENLRKLCE
ncbi:MAG: potassium channel family protein [Acidimicrobiia bacterium]